MNDDEQEQVKTAEPVPAREGPREDWTQRVLAGAVVLLYALVQWYLLSHVIVEEMRELVMRSLGVLDVALGMVLSYYFGSSAGGRQQSETMVQMAAGRRRVP